MTNIALKTKLIEAGILQAENLLLKFREFYPFPLGMSIDSQVIILLNEPLNGIQTSTEVIEYSIEALKKSDIKNHFNAVGICVDVKTVDTLNNITDALEIRVDMRDGNNENFYIPYVLSEDSIVYGAPFFREGTLFFFKTE